MATTMQEYLEEVARRQATGWTPGVPTMPRVSTTWNLPSTARTTMRQAVPKANLGDISAQSNPQSTTKRRGRPRTTPEKLQSISDRAGTGTIKPMWGAISKIAGPAGIAAELLRSEPAVASELAPGTIPGDFRVTQAYPSMAVEEGYPNVSTLPSFDVLSEAGSAWDAAGGTDTPPSMYPNQIGITDPYAGQAAMPTLSVDSVPSDPTGGMIDADALAGRFDVGPTSMAQVGGIQSIIDRGVNKFNDEVQGWKDFYNRPAEEVWGKTVIDALATKEKIDKLGNTNMWGQNVNPTLNPYTGTMLDTPTDFTSPFMDIWDHQYMSPQDATYSQALKSKLATDTAGWLGTLGYGLGQPIQEGLRHLKSDDPNAVTGMGGILAQMHAHMGEPVPANVRQHVDDLIEKNVLGITTPDVTPTTFSPLASPDISAQAMIDEATARQIAQDMSSYPQFASTQETVPLPAAPVSAPMAPRQQAMPEVSIPDALARQDVRTAMAAMAPRQDVMPAAPAGPTQAEIEAQIAAAEQAHRDQQASARQALKDFMSSRAFQEEGASIPAGLIDVATEVDSFANFTEAGSGYQGGYEGMSGFEGYR